MCTLEKLFNTGDADPSPIIVKGVDQNRFNMIKQGDDIISIVEQMLQMKPEQRITADGVVKLLEKYNVQT